MYHIDVRHGVRRYGVRDDRLAGSQLGMRSRHSVGSRQQQLRGRGATATGATAAGSGDDSCIKYDVHLSSFLALRLRGKCQLIPNRKLRSC